MLGFATLHILANYYQPLKWALGLQENLHYMEELDPRIISGVIGAIAALMASFVTQLLVFYIQNKQKKSERLLISYQYALIFLERLKMEGASNIGRTQYYELVSHIAILPASTRKKMVELYGKSINSSANNEELLSEISSFQEKVASKLI